MNKNREQILNHNRIATQKDKAMFAFDTLVGFAGSVWLAANSRKAITARMSHARLGSGWAL